MRLAHQYDFFLSTSNPKAGGPVCHTFSRVSAPGERPHFVCRTVNVALYVRACPPGAHLLGAIKVISVGR